MPRNRQVDRPRVQGFLRSFARWLKSSEGRQASKTLKGYPLSEVDAAKVLMRHYRRLRPEF